MTSTDRPWVLYLRLSDFRGDPDGFEPREARLRAEVARLGGTVAEPPVIENDVAEAGNGRSRPASAFKRRKVTLPSGRTEWRVYRPKFREQVLDPIAAGRANLMCEDLDRATRDPRDLEDLIDACEGSGGSARSVSGSLTLTNGGTDSEITMARMMVAVANKDSRDKARRVAAKRADLAADGSYGGGLRPFGYRPDPAAPKYHKRLLIVPAEEAEIIKAADAVMARVSLAAIARDWRERDVPSVTGAKWTPATLRGVLVKPAVAGLVVTRQDGRVLRPATGRRCWSATAGRRCWPAGRSHHHAAQRDRRAAQDQHRQRTEAPLLAVGYLLVRRSGAGRGGGSGRRYVCCAANHMGRDSARVDAMVAGHVIARLERPDAAHLLAPPARPGVDAGALRAEQDRLTAQGEQQARMWVAGELSDAEMTAASAERKRRLDRIAADLAASSEPDPLAEFRGQPDARAVWESLSLPRQREVARTLCKVTLLPAKRRGPVFDPDSVRVEPAA